MKLDIDSKEQLASLMESDIKQPLFVLLSYLRADIEARVLQYNLSEGPDGLVIAKARAEGAQTLERELLTALKKIVEGERRLNKQRP